MGFFKYDDYSSALADCKSDAYSDKALVDNVLQKCDLFTNNINADHRRTSSPSITALYHIILETYKYKSTIHYLDVGGGGGHILTTLRSLLNTDTIKLRCSVYETATMVKRARERAHKDGLDFIDNLTDIDNSGKAYAIDIVYANSSIQYFPDVQDLITNLLKLNAKFILITRTPFILHGKSFYKKQRSTLSSNGPGVGGLVNIKKIVEYPIYFFQGKELESLLSSKYDLVYSYQESDSTFSPLLMEVQIRTYLFKSKISITNSMENNLQ